MNLLNYAVIQIWSHSVLNREQKLVDELFKTVEYSENLFDRAIESLNCEMAKESCNLKDELNTAEERYKVWNADYDKKNNASDEYVEFNIDEYNDLILDCQAAEAHSSYVSEKIYTLVEMQVIYLFKQLEITLKNLVTLAFDNLDKKALFNWENLKKECNRRNIRLSEADNYVQVNQLRVVNNAIKHSSKITEAVNNLSIPEFRGVEHFSYDTLRLFYKRVEGNISKFLLSFVCKLVNVLGLSEYNWRTQVNNNSSFEFDSDIPF